MMFMRRAILGVKRLRLLEHRPKLKLKGKVDWPGSRFTSRESRQETKKEIARRRYTALTTSKLFTIFNVSYAV